MSREIQNKALNSIIISAIQYAKSYDTGITPQKLFRIIWKMVFDTLFLNGMHDKNVDIYKSLYGAYQLDFKGFLLYKIIAIFKQFEIDYTPTVFSNDDPLLDEIINAKQAIILVSTHNGFTHNLKLFENVNRRITTIGMHMGVAEAMKQSGVKKKINVITKDKYSLAYLKKAVLNGDLISIAVDYTIDNKSFDRINPNLFEFASANTIPLYFTKPEVLQTGDVNIMLKLASPTQTGLENAQDYIKFCNSVGQSRKVLIIRNE